MPPAQRHHAFPPKYRHHLNGAAPDFRMVARETAEGRHGSIVLRLAKLALFFSSLPHRQTIQSVHTHPFSAAAAPHLAADPSSSASASISTTTTAAVSVPGDPRGAGGNPIAALRRSPLLLPLLGRGLPPARHPGHLEPPGRRGLCSQGAEIDSTSITIFQRRHPRSQHQFIQHDYPAAHVQRRSSGALPASLLQHRSSNSSLPAAVFRQRSRPASLHAPLRSASALASRERGQPWRSQRQVPASPLYQYCCSCPARW